MHFIVLSSLEEKWVGLVVSKVHVHLLALYRDKLNWYSLFATVVLLLLLEDEYLPRFSC